MSSILKIAVMAVGGQGGGVLSGWIAQLAENCNYHAQVTSVAGVAQRTGATIYYIEIAPQGSGDPVFALSPSPGDVDVLIAAELMEAGRAVQRGFVTPERTVLITSTHRILAVSEKQTPGDGRSDSVAVRAELGQHARHIVAFDMDAIAKNTESFISASLFGALAKSTALPFSSKEFRSVLESAAKGAASNLAAFEAALSYEDENVESVQTDQRVRMPQSVDPDWAKLLERAETSSCQAKVELLAGLQKTVDYQDIAYGYEYLDRIDPLLGHSFALDQAAAKNIANAMCYDDLPRVADLKTRKSRLDRVREEQEIPDGELFHVTEYFHPRAEEICATLPIGLANAIEARPWAMRGLSALFSKGRRVRSDRIIGFTTLWCVAGLRPWRRRLKRHATEMAHVERLITLACDCLPAQPDLAVEILSCQRLIKGYSDTHARGQSRFDTVLKGYDLVCHREDAADWVRRLREAALKDTTGDALKGALQTVESFAALS